MGEIWPKKKSVGRRSIIEGTVPLRPPAPRPLLAVPAVRAEDRREGTKLQPAQVELRALRVEDIVHRARGESADVMRPPAEGDVRRAWGEVGLVGERVPLAVGLRWGYSSG